MDIVDVTIHFDETTDHERRSSIAGTVRAQTGVTRVAQHGERPHLLIVEYDPQSVSASALLEVVRGRGVHADLIGF